MKQQCFLWSVWLTWLAVPLLAVVAFFYLGLPAAILILVAGVGWQMLYIRLFPRMSASMGYGSVADVPAAAEVRQSPGDRRVTLYTASVCPFCPLVRKRLIALQEQLGFSLTELDVTFRPGVVTAKNLRAVPAVEIDGRLHVGNLTSAELAALLTDMPSAG